MIAGPIDLNRRYSVEEYFALVEASDIKYEYHDGRIIPSGEMLAMAGGAYEHSVVKVNLSIAVGTRLRGHRCQVLDSDMQVHIPNTGFYVFPDLSIVCDEPTFGDPKAKLRLTNPQVVVEVESPSTLAYDRVDKFEKYVRLESLKEYVLVSTSEYRIVSYLRQPDGTWSFAFYVGSESTFRFRSIPLDVPMSEIYDRLTLPLPPAEP